MPVGVGEDGGNHRVALHALLQDGTGCFGVERKEVNHRVRVTGEYSGAGCAIHRTLVPLRALGMVVAVHDGATAVL